MAALPEEQQYARDEKDVALDIDPQIDRRYAVMDNGEEVKLHDAILAERADHAETIWQAIKAHPAAVWWTFVMSCLVIGEAFDSDLNGSLNAMPAFRKQFGYFVNEKAGYQISAKWQNATGQASTIASFISIIICGSIVNRIGYRYTSLIGLAMMIGFTFILFYCKTIEIFFLGKFMCGIPWGFFICIGPAYSCELAPLALRGILTVWIQACWFIGHFIESGIVLRTQSLTSHWAYKIPIAAQWSWPIPIGILIWYAPESPWWLAKQGRLEEAEKAVKRLGAAGGTTPKERVAEMIRTIEIERAVTGESTYRECFTGPDLRRTLVNCMMFVFQNWTGYSLGGNIVYFMEQAGFPSTKSFELGLITVGVQLSLCGLCTILMAWFGRRTLYLFGLGFTILCLLLCGIVAFLKQTKAAEWVQAVLIIMMAVQYGFSVGPITYALIAELPSVKLRAKSVALSRASYYVLGVPTGFIGTYALNPGAWNLKGKSAFIWLGTASACWIAVYFWLPEVKGRSFRELDILFARRVPARKFSSTVIDEADDE